MISAVERGMLRRSGKAMPYLWINEKSSERGHTYVIILTDVDRLRVLDLVPERMLKATTSLLETLSLTQRVSFKAVTIAMRPAFMDATQEIIPHAYIVHDWFHVAKYLRKAVDTVRKKEDNFLSQAGTSPLPGRKYAWLKTYVDGHSAKAVSFEL